MHRIGRVGRAERMGLAISLVSTVGEKVWYHRRKARGASCHNTQLTNKDGCCIWYNEVNVSENQLGYRKGYFKDRLKCVERSRED